MVKKNHKELHKNFYIAALTTHTNFNIDIFFRFYLNNKQTYGCFLIATFTSVLALTWFVASTITKKMELAGPQTSTMISLYSLFF